MERKFASQLCPLIWLGRGVRGLEERVRGEGQEDRCDQGGLEEQRGQGAKGAGSKGSAGGQAESLGGKGA